MKFYKLNIKDLEFSELERLAKKFPKRFFKAKSYLNPDDYYRSMGVYLLLEQAFGDFKESDIELTPAGKPFMKGKDFFSYSHSGDYVVLCTREDAEVGIDVEKIDPSRVKIDKKIFTGKEINFIKRNPTTNFFMLWTKKESLLKALGEGINSIKLNEVEVLGDVFDYKGREILQSSEIFDDHMVTVTTFNDENN